MNQPSVFAAPFSRDKLPNRPHQRQASTKNCSRATSWASKAWGSLTGKDWLSTWRSQGGHLPPQVLEERILGREEQDTRADLLESPRRLRRAPRRSAHDMQPHTLVPLLPETWNGWLLRFPSALQSPTLLGPRSVD